MENKIKDLNEFIAKVDQMKKKIKWIFHLMKISALPL